MAFIAPKSERSLGGERFLASAEYQWLRGRHVAARLQAIDGRDEFRVPRRFVANRIRRSRVLRQHVSLAAAAAEIFLALGTAHARFFHPSGAAIAVEALGLI